MILRKPAIRNSLAVAVLLAIAFVQAVNGEENSLVGVWRGQTPMGGRVVTITITFNPDGTYFQQAVDSVGLQTLQSGHYTTTGDKLNFTVEDWAPKQLSHPPGSMFEYSFPQPGTLFLRDVNFQGTLTMTKVG